jgi:hypothetical protein
LIEPQVNAPHCAEEPNEECMRADLQGEQMETGLVDDANHASKEQKNVGFTLVDDREQAEELSQSGQQRHKNDARNQGDKKGEQKGQRPMSRMMRFARL